MSALRAEAPGKLVIVGEYAVLHGAPAIAAAAGRTATVELRPAAASRLRIVNSGEAFPFSCDQGHVRWQQAPGAHGAIFAAAARVLHDHRRDIADLGPIELTLCSRPFYAANGTKYGLGSSAAVAVALTGCLQQALTGHTDLATALAVHRAFQGGQGSGIDVCASYCGGHVAVARDVPVEALRWPAGVHVAAVWTGSAASTTAMLTQLDQFAADRPAVHAEHIAALSATAQSALDACRTGDAVALLAGLDTYAQQLRALDDATGLGIWSAGHDELARLAAAAGVVYKPSGAGAGDFGLAFGRDLQAIDVFLAGATDAGFAPGDFGLGVGGLRVSAQST